MVPWVPLATVPRPLGQQNTLKSLFSGPNRGITDRLGAVEEVDRELEPIVEWGRMWKVAFELKKTQATVT